MPALFKDEQAHPISLLRSYLSWFGVEAVEWEPEVIRKSIEEKTGTSVAKINLAKLLAAITVANHDSFWRDWESFHFLTQALNNNTPSLGAVQDLSVGEMMVAVDIASQIRKDLGPLTSIPIFAEEVARFIAAQAQESGIWMLPAPLDFANKYAAGEAQKCLECGNVEDRKPDSLCSFCTDRFNVDSLLKFEPDPDLVEKGHGKYTIEIEKYPTARVRRRYRELLQQRDRKLEETQVDVCVARLLEARDYLQWRRKQLSQGASA